MIELAAKSPMRSGAKKVIHVHQQMIRKGEPAIIVRTHKGSTHYRDVEIKGESRLLHSDTPDACGARVWIETIAPVIGDGKELYR